MDNNNPQQMKQLLEGIQKLSEKLSEIAKTGKGLANTPEEIEAWKKKAEENGVPELQKQFDAQMDELKKTLSKHSA